MHSPLFQLHFTDAADLHTGKINIKELTYVKGELLPSAIVALVPMEELERRKEEIDAERPTLADETRFVVHEEKRRRHLARQPRMRVA